MKPHHHQFLWKRSLLFCCQFSPLFLFFSGICLTLVSNTELHWQVWSVTYNYGKKFLKMIKCVKNLLWAQFPVCWALLLRTKICVWRASKKATAQNICFLLTDYMWLTESAQILDEVKVECEGKVPLNPKNCWNLECWTKTESLPSPVTAHLLGTAVQQEVHVRLEKNVLIELTW